MIDPKAFQAANSILTGTGQWLRLSDDGSTISGNTAFQNGNDGPPGCPMGRSGSSRNPLESLRIPALDRYYFDEEQLIQLYDGKVAFVRTICVNHEHERGILRPLVIPAEDLASIV